MNPNAPPNIQLLFGPFLVGTFIDMILYGILILQMYSYYQTCHKDKLWIKYLVLYLLIVETINAVVEVGVVYQPLIINFGLPAATTNFPTMFPGQPITVVAISMPIQLFFAWRVRMLTKSNIIFAVIAAFSTVSAVGGVWTGVRTVQEKVFAQTRKLDPPALVWFLCAAVADLLITATLVHNLSKRRTGFSKTDDAISKIIRMTVQTGMLTAFFAVSDVVFFMTLPHTGLNYIWDFSLSKLYANCLLSALNARSLLQEVASSTEGHRPTKLSDGRVIAELTDAPNNVFSTSLYEIKKPETPVRKPYEHQIDKADLEYGIKITKVTETMQDSDHAEPKGLRNNGSDSSFEGPVQ